MSDETTSEGYLRQMNALYDSAERDRLRKAPELEEVLEPCPCGGANITTRWDLTSGLTGLAVVECGHCGFRTTSWAMDLAIQKWNKEA